MVGRPGGSFRVVTTPRGLFKRMARHRRRATGWPSTANLTRSGVTAARGLRTTRPFTVTRPARMASAAWARDKSPSFESARLRGVTFCDILTGMRRLTLPLVLAGAIASGGGVLFFHPPPSKEDGGGANPAPTPWPAPAAAHL